MSETPKEPLALPVGVERLSDLGTLYTLREASERLGVSVKTVRRMITRGDLLGAHQVPMANGKGTQWVVPYSEIVKQENTAKAQAPAPDQSTTELVALREQVAQLEKDRDLFQALATERGQQLEQLHLTFRLSLPQGKQERRKLFRRK
jgi:excisionase family DNA binding protein